MALPGVSTPPITVTSGDVTERLLAIVGLDRQREVQCTFGGDGWWLKIISLGGATGLLFSFGMPLLLFRHLHNMQRGVLFCGQEVTAAAAAYAVPIAVPVDQVGADQGEQPVEPDSKVALSAIKAKEEDDSEEDEKLLNELTDEAVSVIHQDRRTLTVMGWLFVRFRPSRWYWEFMIMARKALLTLIVVFLGTLGGAALALTLLATAFTFVLQWCYAPFREDAMTFAAARRAQERQAKRSKFAAEGRRQRLFRRVKDEWMMPSLNGLQLVALLMHLVTLACGLACLSSGDPDSGLAIIAGWAALLVIVLFLYMVARYIRPRCKSKLNEPRDRKSVRSRSRRVQPVSDKAAAPVDLQKRKETPPDSEAASQLATPSYKKRRRPQRSV